LIVRRHEGKADLERSIKTTLRGWANPHARFIILRDNAGANCRELKARLLKLCPPGMRERVKVRLVIEMLECWILGDLPAVDKAFGTTLAARRNERKFRDPDKLANANDEIAKLVEGYGKVSGARAVASQMLPARNISRSFRVFCKSLGVSMASLEEK
jgi:hypothetical protein